MNAAYLTPAITLFNEDGSLDLVSQERLFNNLIENGVDGILVEGSSSEFFAMPMDQRREMAKFAIEQVDPRVKLIIGTSHMVANEIVGFSNYCLDAGADDYLAKPFGMMELLSRIRALLRRTETEGAVYRCGVLAVDPGRHTVEVSGRSVALTQKEFEVLCLLLKNRGQVLSREQLIQQVWGYAFTGESRTVDVHVRTLRQKLGEAGAYVETVRGYGYKIGEAV